MLKKYVRIAHAVLDLEPFKSDESDNIDGGLDTGNTMSTRSESSRGPSPKAVEAIRNFLDSRPLSWYPDPEANELKNKLAEYTRISPEHIGCYPGTETAFDYICRTFLEPGTEMVVCGPVFERQLIAARTAGADVVEISHEDPFAPGIEPIIDNIGRRTRMLLVGNPFETNGSFFTEAELVFLLAYAEQTMVVVDESYFEFSGFSVADLVRKFPNLAIIRSFSHAFGLASLKASYILTDKENLSYINRLRSGNGVDAVAQTAALAVLEDTGFMLDYVNSVEQSRRMISSSLPEIGYEFYVAPANFIVLKVSDSVAAIEFMKNNGVAARDLSHLKQLTNYLRITIGDPAQTDSLLLLLSRMAEQFATGFNRNNTVRIANRLNGKIVTRVGA